MAEKKYYAVKNGRVPGIYLTWDDCKKQIDKYSGAIYKSFKTKEEAEQFIGGSNEMLQTHQIEKRSLNHQENDLGKNPQKEMLQAKGVNNQTFREEETMIAYVDGSYNIKTKEFSYGMVILYQNEEKKFASKVENPSLASMRNVAGEIKGAEMAMRYAIEQGCKHLVICHDYEGISRWCLGEWKTNKEGTKAYKAYYDSIKDRLCVTFQKVKGHSGDKYNDMADALAKSAIF